jgi:hypothetical protein
MCDMLEASLPSDMRWIPKGMTVEYIKKAVPLPHHSRGCHSATVRIMAQNTWSAP